jgi:N-acetylneuraminic acid mutarotase
MARVRRVLKVSAVIVSVFVILAGAFIGYLLTSNAYPRPDGSGWARVRSNLPHPRGEVGSTMIRPGPAGSPEICPQAPCAAQLIVVGGLSGPTGTTVGTVDLLDTGSARWRSGPLLPSPRHHPAAAAILGAVYVSGGARNALDWTPQRNLWVLRPGAERWERLPDMPEGRMGHAMVAAGEKLYVIGGRGATSRVLIYDRTSGWTEGAVMPGKRDHLAAVVVLGKIYAIGGRDSTVRPRVDVYTIATDSWARGPDLPRATSGMAAALLADGKIHVVGGEDPGTIGGRVVDRHFVLDLSTNEWSDAPKALLPVHGPAFGEVGGVLVIAGGARRQGAWSTLAWTGVMQRYDPRLAPPASAGG